MNGIILGIIVLIVVGVVFACIFSLLQRKISDWPLIGAGIVLLLIWLLVFFYFFGGAVGVRTGRIGMASPALQIATFKTF